MEKGTKNEYRSGGLDYLLYDAINERRRLAGFLRSYPCRNSYPSPQVWDWVFVSETQLNTAVNLNE